MKETEMKISDVKVGMRLRNILDRNLMTRDVTVTELTEKGFKYDLDRDVPNYPRPGETILRTGGEAFSLDDEHVMYERMTKKEELESAAFFLRSDIFGAIPMIKPAGFVGVGTNVILVYMHGKKKDWVGALPEAYRGFKVKYKWNIGRPI